MIIMNKINNPNSDLKKTIVSTFVAPDKSFICIPKIEKQQQLRI